MAWRNLLNSAVDEFVKWYKYEVYYLYDFYAMYFVYEVASNSLSVFAMKFNVSDGF